MNNTIISMKRKGITFLKFFIKKKYKYAVDFNLIEELDWQRLTQRRFVNKMDERSFGNKKSIYALRNDLLINYSDIIPNYPNIF